MLPDVLPPSAAIATILLLLLLLLLLLVLLLAFNKGTAGNDLERSTDHNQFC
jgi:hypothetical protein